MAGAVRYKWMFRTAAVLFVLGGAMQFWTFGLTDFRPEQRPYGLTLGAISLLIGIFLFRHAKLAIGASALGAGIVCLAATASAPQAKGPVILFLAGLAVVTGVYAALSMRVLFDRTDPTTH